MKFLHIAATTAAFGLTTTAAFAETNITFWHAMGGQLGETVNQMAADFNASQDEYKITPVYKGSYEETLTAGIAAFRAGEQPNIIQVFDAGAATVIGAKGATIPVADLLADNGVDFDINDYITGVRYFYADSDDKMIGMPFNSSPPIMYYNIDATMPSRSKKARSRCGWAPPGLSAACCRKTSALSSLPPCCPIGKA